MRVSQLLRDKGNDVATIAKDRTIGDAVEMLRERGIGALVVTGAKKPLVGILSERDVVRALATTGVGTLEQRVSELMSPEVTTCTAATDLIDLMATMTEQRIRHVPVVDGTKLVGLISIGDAVKARLAELEHDKRDLLDYVSAR